MARTIDEAVGQAIREALESVGMSQRLLGAEVANREGANDPYPQSTVSTWLSGAVSIDPRRLFIIEKILAKRPGSISQIAGFVPADFHPAAPTVHEAIDADPELTDPQRELLMAAYEAARAQTRARRLKRSKGSS